MRYLQWSLYIIGLGLQGLVLTALVNGPLREYFTILLYVLCLFATTLLEIFVSPDPTTLIHYFWIGELLRQSALYLVVVSLVAKAMPLGPRRGALIRTLVLVAVLFFGGSFYVNYSEDLAKWFIPVVRNISFSAAIVNLVLWFVLIAAERRDPRLLAITGALGLQITGDAIGQSLRHLSLPYSSKATSLLGSMVAISTHFLCLYIWWQVFQRRDSNDLRAERARSTAV
ncbi:MAG: hypothetical protein HYZ57_13430 [Acidobacteria bacterium]|nr:hypothetical protein [Acidobacteriota bacterium]MBI3280834.1 hypothetical protein [Acidobacteriota bacterium]